MAAAETPQPALSPRDLARAVGVSESSIKRWADEGRLRVTRTEGGHRRIAAPEAIRFIRSARLDLAHPEILGLTGLVPARSRRVGDEDEGNRLARLLAEGADREARGLVLSLYLSGWSVAAVLDGPIRRALGVIGEAWRQRDDGVFLEHRATATCLQALDQLRSLLPPAEAPWVAIGGAPEGDPYVLPALGAAAVLEGQGYRAVHLGPHSPVSALAHAVERHRPRLVYLSVSCRLPSEAVAAGIRQFAEALARGSMTLVVGGREHRRLRLPPSPWLLQAHSLAELEAFARGLRASG